MHLLWCRKTADDVILSLQESSKNLFKWFRDNELHDNEFRDIEFQGNSGKCHLILSADESAEMLVGESCREKLLGIKIDSKLTFCRVKFHYLGKINKF